MFTLDLDDKDLSLIDAALKEMPYKHAAPLINKINEQLFEMEKARESKETSQ